MSNEKETEVIVVDNCSSDESIEYLQNEFSFVRFIANKENAGFAKANNQALQEATGKYVLFLNPDTIIPEDCLTRSVGFIEGNTNTGAIGVRMVDGTGQFLKESKRGFPSPWVAFCKMTGLTKLFPTSGIFARYYLGWLDENENHEVDSLAGAFMLCRKDVLNGVKGFDERFFMYAEDIDLSYRIQQAGYKNYYFAETTIIHFKGESTAKDFRYVKFFYKAMSQFVRKHYRGGTSRVMTILLDVAIWLKASLAAITYRLKKEKQVKKNSLRKYFVMGDEKSCKEIEASVSPVNSVSNDADTIIYCQGDQLSFKQIIELIGRKGSRKMIHAAGTGSIVGSLSKDYAGEVLLLK